MSDLKLGFIGYGKHARNNLYPSLKLLGVKLQAIATTSEQSSALGKVEQAAKSNYANHIEMFEQEDLDAVFISAPAEQNLQLTLDALDAGLHVFVEKPLGLNAKDAELVVKKSMEQQRIVMVGFMKRYAPAYQEMYKLLGDKRFGQVINVHGMFGVRNFANNLQDMLIYAAIHYADMLISVIGEAGEVSSTQREVDGNFVISFSGVSKSNIPFSMSFIACDAWSKLNEELYVTGTGGYVHVQNVEQLSYHFNAQVSEKPRWQIMDEQETKLTTVSTTSSGGNQQLYQRGFVPELEHFLECIVENRQPLTSATENVKTMELIDKLLS